MINKYSVLGLMSGTSMDGLDCGLFNISLTSDFNLEWSCKDFRTFKYNNRIIQLLKSAISNGEEYYTIADEILGKEFAYISNKFLKSRHIDLVSTHGQTVLHNDKKNTLQVGNPKYLFNTLL